ncbi:MULTISPECIES: IS3 family transposase [unclassified Exiguobacterium]|uniref:IS3 family transposase n=1 Tax=unclassified Exiguobacterium TaxID=2644629 RepID=UPI0035193636
MSKIIFNEHQIRQLESNPNVASVSDRSIQYTGDFKIRAVLENQEGKGPSQIFEEAGFDLAVIGRVKAKSSLDRWRKTYRIYGTDGLLNDRRGKSNAGGRPKPDDSLERRLAKAEARVKYLTAENELFKKARGTREAGETHRLTPKERYQVINTVIRTFRLKNLVRPLCEIAGVSRSGYYAWLTRAEDDSLREERDYADYLLLKHVHDRRDGKIGYRGLYMEVLDLIGAPMNHKRILRLMRKYGLVTKIRRKNAYRKLAKATHEHRTVPNRLNRQFDQDEPGKVFVTDITYLPTRTGQNVYLSCVKDVATREIVAHHLSTSLHMELVFQTTKKLEERLQGNLHPEAMIHSDQGFHYTHPAYQSRIRGLGMVQSMSRRGNCLDNAPIESFFGHLKDHIDHRSASGLTEVRSMVDAYIDYYNSERKQWNLKKMTPEQYRSHLIAA